MGRSVFEDCDAKKCTVYVPKGTYDDYWLSEFGYFENIVEFDATGIDRGYNLYRCQGTLSLFCKWSAIVCSNQGLEHREV